ncbi:D-glycerate dehydrogenase [Candidatus Bipolaricaulota bacterium]|nr:D-glycerate dehydrogenase [Candidatus Bipolaricaulota bacterium]
MQVNDVFITRRIFPEAKEKLKGAGIAYDINDTGEILDKEELLKGLEGKDGLICLLNDEINPEVLDASSDLEIVANLGVGYDNIDLGAATERGIMVTNTPGVLTETTADLSFGLLLAAARRIPEADSFVREGNWEGWELIQPQQGVDVHGKTLGVVGMGRIGSSVARRGHFGFDMDVLYHSRTRKEDLEDELGAEYVELDRLLRKSDFVSIHTPLTQETEGMIGEKELKLMKKDAILVNVARGPVVDEPALVEALKSGEIRGAGLDVFDEEPEVHPGLKGLKESVVLAPHIGSASRETRMEIAEIGVKNAIAALIGEEPPNLINPEVL